MSAPNWRIGPWPTLPSLPRWPTLPNFISGNRPQPTPVYVAPTPQPSAVIAVPGGQCPAGTYVVNQACTKNYPNSNCTTFCASNSTAYSGYSSTSSSVAFVNGQGTSQSTVWQSQSGPTNQYVYVAPTPLPSSTITVQGTQCPANSQLITMACTKNYPNPSCTSYCQPVTGTTTQPARVLTRPSSIYISSH